MGQVSSMTSKGQVTIPKEVRDALGLKPFDNVEIVLDGRGARLRRVLTLREVAGSLPAVPGLTDKEMTAIAQEEHARRYAEKFM
jgi:antitoxin PrlF